MSLKRFIFTVLFSLACVFTYAAIPGDATALAKEGEVESFNWRTPQDNGKELKPLKQKRRKRSQADVPENALYNEECSACHFLYQPWLLPSKSWKIVMGNSEDHFGEDLALDEEDLNEITKYLFDNGAEKSTAYNEWAGKAGMIMRGLRGKTPESIRQVPFIGNEHKSIRAKVFERPDIKSFSNCAGCHRGAAKGNYTGGSVSLPKKKKR